MNITKTHNFNKAEDVSIIPFLEFYYYSEKDISFTAVNEDGGKRPDYHIQTDNSLVEVKEIHDKESNQKHAQWGKIASKLQKAVDNNQLINKVKGTFLVNTPELFKTPTEQKAFESASSQVLQAVIDNKKEVKVFGVDFEINKVSKQESVVVFGSHGSGGSIDPANIVYQNIKDKIATANQQLGNQPQDIQPKKRILLLVNKYYFPLWNWDLFKAISRVYKELLTYVNIDEIWYQFETKDKGFVHKLLYRKTFFEQFEASNFTDYNADDLELFANWFSAMSEMGEEEKNKLLMALRYFLKDKRPYQIFLNSQTREEMVRLGLWLAEKELFNDAIWLVEQFIIDNDPPLPEDYKGDEKFNYHKQVLNNEDVNIITTVLGHLAWVIQKLAVRKNYIVKALEFTQILLNHPNLYVKLQGVIPLVEIAARRQWLEEYDKENNTKHYSEFRKLAFNLLDKYSQYRAIANSSTHVFYYFKDINTKEAIKVLDKLKGAREAAALFVYFGIFRERHFKDKVLFDPKPLRRKLILAIKDNQKEYEDLQGSIAWNFWRILAETPDEFNTLKPYIDLFFRLPYSKRYYSSLERIIEEWIERKPEICISWFINSIEKLLDYVDNNEMTARNTWIEPEKPLQFIASNKPSMLVGLVGKLVKLWKHGAFVGSPREIFETYRLVQDINTKNKIRDQFKLWYGEMKAINQKLEHVSWE
ncbi:MAG: hypothetical protein A3A58_02120 [Candidatus Blackburnbacteria bacterium RIFCSPLOWO2_01_FULL_41_27]|uniref:Uncharacterized protein n=1 Tax=Candidatus Blackburnbacteria bacterium RIFCSPLOWO2_01_FULL_41_27 TaxID=1797520 RepID=A0A1G1VCY6_9BACT|nr:MAG: hypothetical protein A3F30_01965 [Candidatus Levybacteria bacterium RIFCSPHIGHO2_12_FULL_37_12]OGY13201.1 MAG: hypothetical protein A3A58_02120 [Candidatus Blackburnbacteria bacterium RIFCSPLOWO2_01_FULL_41_27]